MDGMLEWAKRTEEGEGEENTVSRIDLESESDSAVGIENNTECELTAKSELKEQDQIGVHDSKVTRYRKWGNVLCSRGRSRGPEPIANM
ncbi:hypothetical protein EVAR_88787_1 [Eumeta japonica]|uniref:Uncharacterized protein n=1 Tax=Eumeta variegata TaxID=151549 RepID=A0A4C1XTS9_EUMVA|nr:hypothetical protein EVAR_88787_1 [Eumeta japonica]